MEIARRIGRLCAQSSLSRGAIARQTGLDSSSLSRLEAGEAVPTWEILDRLACTLNVPVSRFFVEEGEAPVTPLLTPRVKLEDLETLQPAAPDSGRAPKLRTFANEIKAVLTLAGRKLR